MTGGPNPYIGPNPFTTDNRQYFFGRDEETAILRGLVLVRRATLLFAQSGAGKSSLLNAGLIPALTGQRADDPEPIMRLVLTVANLGADLPTDVLPGDVANAFVLNVLLSLRPAEDHRSLARQNLTEGMSDVVNPGNQTQSLTLDSLLIIDQFEELFTRHLDRYRDREDFFKQVSELLRGHPDLRVLFSMREDYIAELTPYVGLLPDQLRSRFRLERLKPGAALDAVRLPARKAGREFLKGAAEELVERLCRDPSTQQGASTTFSKELFAGEDTGIYVEPVHLQVVCRQLWSRLPPDRREIGVEDVQQLGDVHEALADFYSDAVKDAARAIGNRELPVRYWFERQLITAARTRGLVYQDKTAAATGGLPNAAVDVLDRQHHVIRPIRRGNDDWYELSHDRMIEPILKANANWWLRQPRLVQAARAWDRGGRTHLPTIDSELEEAVKQADEIKLESFVRDFVVMARAGATDKAQQDRLLKRDLSELGWGIIFAQDADPALQAALTELLIWRNGQAKQRFRLFAGSNGYKAGENASEFLERSETSASMASAETMPYYLAVIGSPTAIPFEFQYYLSLNHAVGRIAFDTLPEYANYARSVVTAESGQVVLPRRAVLFTTRNPDDMPTNYVYERLITPLLQELRASDLGWDIEPLSEERARKQDLRRLLEDEPAWSFLFVAAHALMFRMDDLRQRNENGALLCYDWPGPLQWKGKAIPPEFYFAASDAESLSRPQILGSIAFLFGECTAGTPRLDNFASRKRALYGTKTSAEPDQIAPESFIARLPQRLMSHPGGGALAVVGHVDVNWTTSFVGRTGRGESKIGAYLFLLKRLMAGYPVGAAMEEFRNRFVRELTRWTEIQMQLNMGKVQDPAEANEYATRETAMVDLRNYIILGDPAVRLTTTEPAAAASAPRPVLDPATGLPELKLHPAPIISLAWSPDGAQLLTVCSDGATRIWPTGAGKPWVFPLRTDEAVQAAAWRVDGRQVATLSRKGDLVTWDVDAMMGGDAAASAHLTDQADLMLWQPGGAMLAVISGVELRVYDCTGAPVVRTIFRHDRPIRACAWSPDGRRLASTGRDATFRVWDTVTGKEITRLKGSSDQENLGLVRWSPDVRFLAYTAELRMIGSPQQTSASVIRILDAASMDLVCELAGHGNPVRVLDWHPAGDLLASVSNDRAVVWNVSAGQQRFTMEPKLSITESAFSPDGRMLVTTGDDQVVRLWNEESGAEVGRSDGHGGRVTGVVWHPDSTLIAMARSDGVALLIQVKEISQPSPT
jgi:WD40 repeat protein